MTKCVNTFDEYVEYKKNKTFYSHKYFSKKITTLEFIKNNGHNKEINLHWSVISLRNDLTPEFVMKNLDLPWDWDLVYANPNITIEFVEKNPYHKDEYFRGLSDNPNLTLEFLIKHSESPHWIYDCDEIAYFSDFRWRYYYKSLSKNENFDISWYLKLPDKKWNIKYFAYSNHFDLKWLDIAPLDKEYKKTWFLPMLAGKIPDDLFFQYLQNKKYVTEYNPYDYDGEFKYSEEKMLDKIILHACMIKNEEKRDSFIEKIFQLITNKYDLTNHENFVEILTVRGTPKYKLWRNLTLGSCFPETSLKMMRKSGYDKKSIEMYRDKYNVIE